MATNGRLEVVLKCGRCEGCKANARCERPTSADKLPDPCCTWCGHNPHAGECDDCPCTRRGP